MAVGRVRFIENPFLDDQVEEATLRALDDAGEEVKSLGSGYISPFSSSAAAAIEAEPAHRGPSGPAVVVKIGQGLGRIFEFSKQMNRHTRSTGANRGVMQRREFFHRAKEEVVRRGLELARYL